MGAGKKPTKRERKFQASGGIQRRLAKGGTVLKKGRLRPGAKRRAAEEQQKKRPPRPAADADADADAAAARRDRWRQDLTSPENLAGLDLDGFFAEFAERASAARGDGGTEDDDSRSDCSDDGDDDEDDDGDSSASGEEDAGPKPRGKASREGNDGVSSSDDSDAASDSDDEAQNYRKRSRSADGDSGSDSGSGSDDEDVHVAETRMKRSMAQLQRQDPEFHKFLESNERSLLEFGDDEEDGAREEDDDDDDDDEDDDDDAGSAKESRQSRSDAVELTPKVLKSLEQGTFRSHGIKSLKQLVAAYKSACHLADTDPESMKKKPGESDKSFIIDSSKIFDQLMLLCLTRCHEAFHYHLLGVDDKPTKAPEDAAADVKLESLDNKPLHPHTLENSKHWSTIRPILLSFVRSTSHLMSEAKEPEQLVLVLDALSKYIRFLTPFPRLAEAMLKSLISLWSAAVDASEYQVVRLKAFIRIRQLALTQPFPFIEECLKKCYLAYAKSAKLGGASSVAVELPRLTFMGNCLVELYSLDYDSSYQHAFVYVRQLALLLRTAMQKKTPEAFQQVYCWQYLLCLKLWVAVLSSAATEEDGALLSSLIYPLTEIILGVTRSGPSPTRHLPLRLHCVRLLQQLAAASEKYIPTTLLLLDTMSLKEWHLKPKKSQSGDARALQMNLILRLPKEDPLRTHPQLEAAMTELMALLQRELDLYRFSAGFPEFSIQIVQSLKNFAKETRNPRWKAFARGCLDTCERYAAFAVDARSKLAEGPKDVQRLECLRPPKEPTMSERHHASLEKERKQWEAARPVETQKRLQEDQDADVESDEEEKKKTKQQRKKKAKAADRKTNPAISLSKEALAGLMAEKDEVNEGVNWSDEE